MTTARDWQEAADEVRALADDPTTDEGRRALLNEAAIRCEIEAIRALFAERADEVNETATNGKGEMP